jgi:hypothetical protein
MRSELTPLPPMMRSLHLDDRGYPVPWFVAWVPTTIGHQQVVMKPEFRAMDPKKWARAIREKICWVCGHQLGKKFVFVVGPMCGVNRISSEPPSHVDCARWSAINCPFLNLREKRRRGSVVEELPGARDAAGIAIERNPGVTLLWHTSSFFVFDDGLGKGGKLVEMGEPRALEWYCRGRNAESVEIREAIDAGLPSLYALAKTPYERAHVAEQVQAFDALMQSKALV